MPFFHYVAKDKKGAQVEGTIQAADTEEATRVLALRGFQVSNIIVPEQRKAVAPQTPAKQARPQAQPQARPILTQIRTKRGSDRQRFFLFAQIANQLKAGISPADAFPTLASQLSHQGFAESLRRIAAGTAEGRPMSQIMGMYPALYPDHVVGLVRAGEMGGFVPDACAAVSEQAGSAYKFRIWHWFVWFMAVSVAIVLPIIAIVMNGIVASFHKNWSGNASSKDGVSTVLQSLGESFRGPQGLISFGILLAFGVGLWLFNRPGGIRMRHWLGLKYPIYGKRAVSEGVTIFSWALGLLSRGGAAPNTAWALAAECVPNMVLRERLVDAGRRMTATSRVSEAVFGSKLFSDEYAPVISTGEMTGDLPGSLERLAQVHRAEFDTQSNYAKVRAVGWGCLLFLVGGGGGMILIYYYYSRILWYLMDHGSD